MKGLIARLKTIMGKVDRADKEQRSQWQAPQSPPLREVSPEELKEILEAHRKWLSNVESGGEVADLSRTNLKGADLSHADLRGANLQHANLTNAHLAGTRLSSSPDIEDYSIGTNLYGAKLDGANLHEADLHGANLSSVSFKEAYLPNARLSETKLEEANLQGANLIYANLNKADLYGANLSDASLDSVDLEHANLALANLRGASLRHAKLQKASLYKAQLRDADLQDADLTDATGLVAEQLAGANVSGANLPQAIAEFEGLKIVEEASKNTRKLFHLMLLGCLYCWLTIATTTDARLLTNSPLSPLPIIGTPIPIVGFYWAAPLLLLGLYFYFHLYLQRLWEGLADLPAVFPDGRPSDKKCYPWLLNGLVRSYFVKLKNDRPPLSQLQVALSIILAYWLVPVTLILFWLRYLRRHDLIITAAHVDLITLSIIAAALLHRLSRLTLGGRDRKPFFWRTALKDRRTYAVLLFWGAIHVIFGGISVGAIEGVPIGHPDYDRLGAADVRRWVPRAFRLIGYSPLADLVDAEVSTKPANWSGRKEENAFVKGAQLQGRNLRGARAAGAFLVNADLRGADLERADFSNAKLWGADLRWSNLKGADLNSADLGKSKLGMANFFRARLDGVDLSETALPDVNFSGINLAHARFQNALLLGVDFQRAILFRANLQDVYLGWADLRGADLTGADLTRAILVNADLRGANLQGAETTEGYLKRIQDPLVRAYFYGYFLKIEAEWANIRNAKGLTKQQIESAIIDETTRLPDYLKVSLKAKSKTR